MGEEGSQDRRGVPGPMGRRSQDPGRGRPEPRGRGPEAESVAPLARGPALTVHAGEGQRLCPELLLHCDLQVELDVVHAGDDFLHGGGGGHTGPTTPQVPRRPRTSTRHRPRRTLSSASPCLAAATAARRMPGAPGARAGLWLVQTRPTEPGVRDASLGQASRQPNSRLSSRPGVTRLRALGAGSSRLRVRLREVG